MKILVLDDDNERHSGFKRLLQLHEVTHVYTVDGAISALIAGSPFDVVFLDHDLNDFHYKSTMDNGGYGRVELNGTDVATFIAKVLEKEKKPGLAVVHSWNPPGAESMLNLLRDGEVKCLRWAYGADVKNLPVTLTPHGRL